MERSRRHPTNQPVLRKIATLYSLAIAYAAIRYTAFTPENLYNLPVFVINKGLSMGAALCFTLAFWHQWRARRTANVPDSAAWFRAGIFGALVHVPMSLVILRPGYFAEFFSGDRLSFIGEAVFLFGALTAGGIYLMSRTPWTPRQRWWLSLATVSTLFTHTLSMGIARGFNIDRDHAFFPPMWFLSLVGTAMGIAFLLLSPPSSTERGL